MKTEIGKRSPLDTLLAIVGMIIAVIIIAACLNAFFELIDIVLMWMSHNFFVVLIVGFLVFLGIRKAL